MQVESIKTRFLERNFADPTGNLAEGTLSDFRLVARALVGLFKRSPPIRSEIAERTLVEVARWVGEVALEKRVFMFHLHIEAHILAVNVQGGKAVPRCRYASLERRVGRIDRC